MDGDGLVGAAGVRRAGGGLGRQLALTQVQTRPTPTAVGPGPVVATARSSGVGWLVSSWTHRLPAVSRPVVVVAVGLVVVAGLLAVSSGVVASGSAPTDPDLPWSAGAAGAAPSQSVPAGATTTTTVQVPPGGQDLVGPVVVHVAGAVAAQGVHRLEAGARMADAVEAAGGVVDGADVNQLNLAALVTDGQRVYVPWLGETVDAHGGGAVSGPDLPVSPESGPTGPLSLSRASHTELQTLPGVGPATADAIVEHRTAVGGFGSVEDLLEVRGIGPAKLEGLRDLVVP